MAALFYVANWRMIFRGGDYFAQTAAPSPLEHTWSLGHRGAVLPAVATGAVRCCLRRGRTAAVRGRVRAHLWWLVVLCVVGAAASTAALAATYSAEDPGRAYYGTDTRGAAILIGAALAALLALRSEGHTELSASRRRRPRHVASARGGAGGSWVGCAAAAVATVWASTHVSGTDEVLYRGGMAVVALAVAVVIAHVVLVPSGLSARLLSVPPLPALGSDLVRRLPVALAGVHRRQRRSDRTGRPDPVRGALPPDRGHRLPLLRARRAPDPAAGAPRRPVFAATGAGVAVAAGAVVLVVGDRGAPTAGAADGDVGRRRGGQFLEGDGMPQTCAGDRGEDPTRRTTEPAPSRGAAEPPLHHRRPGQPVVVDVFGDSVAWTLVTYLPSHPELDVRDRTLMGCGISRTAPFRYFGRLYAGLCRRAGTGPRIWRAAIARDDPDVAFILVGRWETMDRVLDGRWTHVGDPEFDAHLRSELDLAIRVAGARGAHVLLATEPYNRRGEQLDGSLYPEDEPERVTDWNQLLRSVASGHPDVEVIEFGERVSPEGRFSWTAGGYQVRSDGLHLTPSGVQGWIAPGSCRSWSPRCRTDDCSGPARMQGVA